MPTLHHRDPTHTPPQRRSFNITSKRYLQEPLITHLPRPQSLTPPRECIYSAVAFLFAQLPQTARKRPTPRAHCTLAMRIYNTSALEKAREGNGRLSAHAAGQAGSLMMRKLERRSLWSARVLHNLVARSLHRTWKLFFFSSSSSLGVGLHCSLRYSDRCLVQHM